MRTVPHAEGFLWSDGIDGSFLRHPSHPHPASRGISLVAGGGERPKENPEPVVNGEAMGVVDGTLPTRGLPLALAV